VFKEPNPWVSSPIGGILNFYRGFMPTLYGMIPYAGVSFLTYETMKSSAQTTTWMVESGDFSDSDPHGGPHLKWWAQLGIGGLSGAVAQTSSYPMEIIRRHMQIAGKPVGSSSVPSATSSRFVSTLETANKIYLKKGFKGFFVGLSIGYVKIIPMSAGKLGVV
jgi:solute carrier family 25 protein 16